VFFLKKKKAFI